VNLSQSYGASPAIQDYRVLPATRHRSTCPTVTPANQLVLNLPTPEGRKTEFTLVLVTQQDGLPMHILYSHLSKY